jgi:hypothetical protein
MTHHELDHLDQTQRRMFLEAVERGEPIEKAIPRIADQTRKEFVEIVLHSNGVPNRTDTGITPKEGVHL